MNSSIALGLLSTTVLAALHLLAPRIRRLTSVREQTIASFGGGIAASYVFLHLLPEVATGNAHLREYFGEPFEMSLLSELGIFSVALAGFCVFYAVEWLAVRLRASGDPASDGEAGEKARSRIFWVHVGSFAVYNAIITYTMPSTYRTGVAFAVLFTIAMGLHFVLSDRSLEEHYGRRFARSAPRLLLAGALVLGWALAWLFAPTRAVTISVLTAFLAGSVLFNVFKEEIPSARRSSFPWFITGLLGYAVLLGAVTAVEG